MNKELSSVLGCVIVSVVLNLVLPFIVKPMATEKQISPPDGADKLNFFDQIIHMLVHHSQVPVTSSIIVALIVGLSVYFGKFIKL